MTGKAAVEYLNHLPTWIKPHAQARGVQGQYVKSLQGMANAGDRDPETGAITSIFGGTKLAKRLCMAPRTLQRHVSVLIANGYLVLLERGGMFNDQQRANIYAIPGYPGQFASEAIEAITVRQLPVAGETDAMGRQKYAPVRVRPGGQIPLPIHHHPASVTVTDRSDAATNQGERCRPTSSGTKAEQSSLGNSSQASEVAKIAIDRKRQPQPKEPPDAPKSRGKPPNTYVNLTYPLRQLDVPPSPNHHPKGGKNHGAPTPKRTRRSGVSRRGKATGTRPSWLCGVTVDELRNLSSLLGLMSQAAKAGIGGVTDTSDPRQQLAWVAMAEHALRVADNPAAMFASNVSRSGQAGKGLWDYITGADEVAAQARLNQHKREEADQHRREQPPPSKPSAKSEDARTALAMMRLVQQQTRSSPYPVEVRAYRLIRVRDGWDRDRWDQALAEARS